MSLAVRYTPAVRRPFLAISSAVLVSGLPLFLIVRDLLFTTRSRLETGMFLTFVVLVGAVGLIGRRVALLQRPAVVIPLAGFLTTYWANWVLWPKGTDLDRLMWAYWVPNALAPLVLGASFTRQDLTRFLNAVAVLGASLGTVVLVYLLASETAKSGLTRFTVAESLNPITQSLAIGFAVMILYAKLLYCRRPWILVVLPSLLVAMVIGGSRGPVIALLAGALVVTAMRVRKGHFVLWALAVAACSIAALWLVPETVWTRYTSAERWLDERTGEGIPLRVDRLRVALGYWLDHPLLGSGPTGNQEIYYAHNLMLQLLMETGLVGTAAFLTALISCVLPFARRLRRRVRTEGSDGWTESALAGFLVMGLVQAQFAGHFMLLAFLWLSIGALAASYRLVPDVLRQRDVDPGRQLPRSMFDGIQTGAP